ncbi:hypothetical protein Tchl_0045 [Thauera chlorobenzoica]|uniref:SPOR domain-containing protein n=2 Tax=Thauera chlorobenzoica TaxID=96773 RepID=A0A1L6F7N8_9RHOO|nr:hypothetical protein Tchl_0045 [Thauera chlorobenzoica]
MNAMEETLRWVLWRLDDNGNRFVVAAFARRDEAEAAARAFAAHGHKQTYWVETAADGDTAADRTGGV